VVDTGKAASAGKVEASRLTVSGVNGCPVLVLGPPPTNDSASSPTPTTATAPTLQARMLAIVRRKVGTTWIVSCPSITIG